MGDIKGALFTYLSTEPAVTALVGDRIYANWAPPTTPHRYVIISRIDGNPYSDALNGSSPNTQSTVQLDIWGNYSAEVEDVVKVLQARLNGFKGTMGNEHISSMRQTSVFDGPLAPNDGATDASARSTMTYEVWHRERST